MPDALQDLHGSDYGHVSVFLLNHPELTHLYRQSLARLTSMDNQDRNQPFDEDNGCFPPLPRFWIVNDFDRPDEKFIAELRKDDLLYYIHPELREEWKKQGLDRDRATRLEDFGILWDIKAGIFAGARGGDECATYPDGRPRRWQGSNAFTFPFSQAKEATSIPAPPTSDTPETDALYFSVGNVTLYDMAGLCKQLERQRNQLNHHLHNVLEGHHGAFAGAREYLKALRAGGLGE